MSSLHGCVPTIAATLFGRQLSAAAARLVFWLVRRAIGSQGPVIDAGILRLTTLDTGDLLVRIGPGFTREATSGFMVRTLSRQLQVSTDLAPIGWLLNQASGQGLDIASKVGLHRIRLFWSFSSTTSVGGTPNNPRADRGNVGRKRAAHNRLGVRRSPQRVLLEPAKHAR